MFKMIFMAFGFIVGFTLATYWEGGRALLIQNSPQIKKEIKNTTSKAVKGISDALNKKH